MVMDEESGSPSKEVITTEATRRAEVFGVGLQGAGGLSTRTMEIVP
jgi:hypothetical protein